MAVEDHSTSNVWNNQLPVDKPTTKAERNGNKFYTVIVDEQITLEIGKERVCKSHNLPPGEKLDC